MRNRVRITAFSLRLVSRLRAAVRGRGCLGIRRLDIRGLDSRSYGIALGLAAMLTAGLEHAIAEEARPSPLQEDTANASSLPFDETLPRPQFGSPLVRAVELYEVPDSPNRGAATASLVGSDLYVAGIRWDKRRGLNGWLWRIDRNGERVWIRNLPTCTANSSHDFILGVREERDDETSTIAVLACRDDESGFQLERSRVVRDNTACETSSLAELGPLLGGTTISDDAAAPTSLVWGTPPYHEPQFARIARIGPRAVEWVATVSPADLTTLEQPEIARGRLSPIDESKVRWLRPAAGARLLDDRVVVAIAESRVESKERPGRTALVRLSAEGVVEAGRVFRTFAPASLARDGDGLVVVGADFADGRRDLLLRRYTADFELQWSVPIQEPDGRAYQMGRTVVTDRWIAHSTRGVNPAGAYVVCRWFDRSTGRAVAAIRGPIGREAFLSPVALLADGEELVHVFQYRPVQIRSPGRPTLERNQHVLVVRTAADPLATTDTSGR